MLFNVFDSFFIRLLVLMFTSWLEGEGHYVLLRSLLFVFQSLHLVFLSSFRCSGVFSVVEVGNSEGLEPFCYIIGPLLILLRQSPEVGMF